MQEEKRPFGRPAGSGEQLAVAERNRKSRQTRTAAGATRLDVMLDAASSDKLTRLIEQWQCVTKKEAVERALAIVLQTIPDARND
jgi:hypothetical protein